MAQAVGRYRERPVSGPLGEHFTCCWIHKMPRTGSATIVVVPDGHIDLIWADGALRVAGPDQVFQVETLEPGTTIVGYRFQPGRAASWLGLPMSEIVDSRPRLAEIWGREAEHVTDQLGMAEGISNRFVILEAALAKRAATVPLSDTRMQAVHALLATAAGRDEPIVPWLMAELGMSERTLRRHCHEFIGYGPKTLDRNLRFQRFLQLLRICRNCSIAQLAIAAGYADQAHLSRECRRLAGSTPSQIASMFSHTVLPGVEIGIPGKPAVPAGSEGRG